MVCLFRAAEQRRPEQTRALVDPYAKWFLGPIALRLRCARVTPVGPLDPGLGPRRAGWRLESVGS